MLAYPTVLLADADVLIDYRESELAILALVVQHVGRVAVVPSVLDEVQDVTVKGCVELGIEIVEVETERLLQAAAIEFRVSFNDRLCLVVCREDGWTCVTNDGALRWLCERHGVETRFGLGLMRGWSAHARASGGCRTPDSRIEPLPHQRASTEPLRQRTRCSGAGVVLDPRTRAAA